jgi:tripartite ATP-independent transporter DctP family solute receptor
MNAVIANSARLTRRQAAASLVALGTALGARGAQAQRVRVLRFGAPTPDGSTYNQAMAIFRDEAAKLSNGRLKIELYPSSQLGSIKDMVNAVQLGSQQIGMAVPAWFSSFAKQLDVFSLPFMVASVDRLREGLDGAVGRQTSGLLDAAGFKVLGYWVMGFRQTVNNVHPIQVPADFAGLKIRVITSPVFIETFRTLGANPVGLDSAEMYLALQQHTVDGVENAAVDIVNYKLYEVSKYLSLTSHIMDFFIVVANKSLFDSLPPDDQSALMQAMKTSMDWEWKAQPIATAAAIDKLKQLMTMNELTAGQRKQFIDATRPVYDKFTPLIGKDVVDTAVQAFGTAV